MNYWKDHVADQSDEEEETINHDAWEEAQQAKEDLAQDED